MKIQEDIFGRTPTGEAIQQFTMSGGDQISIQVITYGATLSSVKTPDAKGKVEEVTLGFDNLAGYLGSHPYFGSTLGRVANRIGLGQFSIAGTSYTLFRNDGKNHLHGGKKGFDKVIWKAEKIQASDAVGVRLKYLSPNGEEGYPGNLETIITYTMYEDNRLQIVYEADTDRPTPINLSNHAYWNLKGAGCGDIKDHLFTVYADGYLPVDKELIPTGKIQPVDGTPYDFRTEKAIGKDLAKVNGGYDVCYVLQGKNGTLRKAARVYEKESGRGLEIQTTQPGVQLYSGHMIPEIKGRKNIQYNRYSAFALETQGFPDAINKPDFPSVLLRPGEHYHEQIEIKFFHT